MDILAQSLRPRSLSGMVGQEKIVAALRKQMATRPPKVFLFHGATGTGKTTLAKILATSLQCDHQEKWGDPCKECCSHYDEFSILESNSSEENGVEDLGKLVEMSRFMPTSGKKRVIVLDEAQRITSAAQNLLLKPLESVPEHMVWIICTTDPSKLLPTLRRRCMQYKVSSLTEEGVTRLLERGAKKIALKTPVQPLADMAYEMQIYSPGVLYMALEQYAAGMKPAEALLNVGESATNSYELCKAVSGGRWSVLRGMLKALPPEEVRWIRAAVGGWLRAMLFRENDPKRSDLIAECLSMLMDGRAPFDDGALLMWTQATLYKVCRKLRAINA